MMYTRNPDAIWTEVDGEIFVMSVTSGRYFTLKGVGGFIWQSLEAPTTRDNLLAKIVDRYAVAPEKADADLSRFVEQLATAQLVFETGGNAGNS